MSAGQLRIIKGRIRSVENTKKITRAMEMVSASKLRRFQIMMTEARPYTQELERILLNLVRDQQRPDKAQDNAAAYSHPFLEEREETRTALVLVTADSGLCGPYNMELIEQARRFINARPEHPPLLFGVGKSGILALKRAGRTFQKTFTEVRVNQIEDSLKQLKTELECLYLEKKIDAVYVVYSHFISATLSKATVQKILPFKQPDAAVSQAGLTAVPYIYEPSPDFVFSRLIPVFFESKIRMMLLEAWVSEHMARMHAMHQATKNAKEMIDSLVLYRNKVRQAIITKEIIEIISGAKASKK